jgi:hypothetical protein
MLLDFNLPSLGAYKNVQSGGILKSTTISTINMQKK